MPSINYNSMVQDAITGVIDFDTDTFKAMLVTSGYVPNQDTDTKRSDVTNEVVGAGYTAGGQVVAATVVNNPATNRITVAFAPTSWPSATIAAAGIVIYKSRGGLASADELVAYGDFGGTFTSTGGTFAVTFTAPITFQN